MIGRNGNRDRAEAIVDRYVASQEELLAIRAEQFANGEIPDVRHPFSESLDRAAWVTSPEGRARLLEVAREAAREPVAA